ncbi:unnamed protein product [Rotaria sp. Silwood1]|nr:unnamed protein product [Rotaria sp. Silwood1]
MATCGVAVKPPTMNSIPYAQIRSKEDIFSSDPQLIHDDQILSSSSDSSPSSTPELERHRSNPLINLEIDDDV